MSALSIIWCYGFSSCSCGKTTEKKAKARQSARMQQVPSQMPSPSAGMGMQEMARMAMGGEVKRTKSIDGVAMKGKTRA